MTLNIFRNIMGITSDWQSDKDTIWWGTNEANESHWHEKLCQAIVFWMGALDVRCSILIFLQFFRTNCTRIFTTNKLMLPVTFINTYNALSLSPMKTGQWHRQQQAACGQQKREVWNSIYQLTNRILVT